MQRKKTHRWQRFLILLITVFILVLLWPFFTMKGVKTLWVSSRFSVPDLPDVRPNFSDAKPMPEMFFVVLKSHDQKILSTLQAGGWPAYLQGNEIYIGPYLESFRSQVDLKKIRQIAPIPATIQSAHHVFGS